MSRKRKVDTVPESLGLLFLMHFIPCDLIFELVQERRPKLDTPDFDGEFALGLLSYQHIWLALLYVVVDGYRKLRLNYPSVDAYSNSQVSALRNFRNVMFHSGTGDEDLMAHYTTEQMNWALQIHVSLRRFFAANNLHRPTVMPTIES